jgi:hypothetical protein
MELGCKRSIISQSPLRLRHQLTVYNFTIRTDPTPIRRWYVSVKSTAISSDITTAHWPFFIADVFPLLSTSNYIG